MLSGPASEAAGRKLPPGEARQALQTFLATYGAPSLQALEQQLQAYEADWNRHQEALALHTRKLAGLEVRRKELWRSWPLSREARA